ncbi:MAG: hypothetical protein N3D85_06520 [Candidatus Bathyarchaeota archaeon]|nr:hypothetical protein [Candidatus Bathyarchaeota archaeon]
MIAKEIILAKLDSRFLPHVTFNDQICQVNAEGLHYRDLNSLLRTLDSHGVEKVELHSVCGQRYIGTDLKTGMAIEIYGTPGNDLAAFMNGPYITVYGNAQDCVANTMNEGKVVVHGRAGDITCYGMRGGKVFIRDDIGARAGIHMKEYMDKKPYLVVGGTAMDFLGEYMAGGVLLVLGLNLKGDEPHKARFVGTGMHAGVIYVRGNVAHMGKEVKMVDVEKSDMLTIEGLVREFCGYFKTDFEEILSKKFMKIVPYSHRPYGRIYAY